MQWLALFAVVQSGAGSSPAQEAAFASDPDWIDRAIEEKAAAAGAALAPIADDATFLRRVTLDLAGVAPSAADVSAFLDDAKPDKRRLRIDALLATEDCTDRLARFLLEMTTESRATYVWFANLFEYQEWLKDSLRAGHSYDRIVRDILTATGQTNVNGAANFAMFHRARPDRLAAGAVRSFLGENLACAQCHDHPSRGFTRDQFWGVAAFFARTNSYLVTNGDHGIAESRFGRISMPPADRPEFLPVAIALGPEAVAVEARWLDGTPARSEANLREQLADFILREPAFARNAANRVWQRLFGRALAEPVDDVGDPPSHPELLAALARFFADSGYELRALLRAIANSRTYQRSSRIETPCDERLFTRALPRPLDVDQLLATLERAAGIELSAFESGTPTMAPAAIERPPSRADLPSIAKEIEGLAPDPSARRAILDPAEAARIEKYQNDEKVPLLFGGDPGSTEHALVRRNLMQGLCTHLVACAVAQLGESIDARHVDWLWRSLLSRPPTADETVWAVESLRRGDTRPNRALADLAWVLLNGQEFSTNH